MRSLTRKETILSVPPYSLGGTASSDGATIAMLSGIKESMLSGNDVLEAMFVYDYTMSLE